MIYRPVSNDYRDFKVIEKNKLAARSYFIPFSSVKAADKSEFPFERYGSDRVICLSGLWDFHFFKKMSEIPKILDTSKLKFDKIPVPSCWNMLGYEQPMYVNVKYPFACKPPYIPGKKAVGVYPDFTTGKLINGTRAFNTAGLYRKEFDLRTSERVFYLSFLGVSGAFSLFVNGSYVGYSEGSHNTAEFDVSRHLVSGRNEIVALVYKWSTGSYLECQDMFRHSGIFRDVLLYCHRNPHIYDINIENTNVNSTLDKGKVTLKVNNPAGCKVRFELKDASGAVRHSAVYPAEEKTIFEFSGKFDEYSAETPALYDYEFTLMTSEGEKAETVEFIRKKSGFRNVVIKEGVLYYNGKPIKLKGVNRHDSDPVKGYAVGIKEMLKDIEVMKEFNVNTVRTSHYPPDPMFMELMDKYGFYVIAEADIETHGTFPLINRISNNRKWAPRYIDRVVRMYETHKNSPSVMIWSLGNEAGGIRCQDACYEILSRLSTLPVHYEGAVRTARLAYDVFSVMYPSVDALRKFLTEGKKGRTVTQPIFMCEYAHAMGTGPGNIQEYWDVIESSDRYLGGCIWEFCDHAVYHENGKYRFTYGGDHGEYAHDGNFCVDGLFSPQRKPHTGAYSMQYVYRPLRARLIDDSTLEIFNTDFFKGTTDTEIVLSVINGGKEISRTSIKADIAPRTKRKFTVFLGHIEGDMFLNVKYVTKYNEVTEQIVLSEALPEINTECAFPISVKDNKEALTINFENGYLRIDKTRGEVTNYVIGGEDYLDASPVREGTSCFSTCLTRPRTDNDRRLKFRFIDNPVLIFKDIEYTLKRAYTGQIECAEIIIASKVLNDGKELFVSEDMLEVYPNGKINVFASLQTRKKTGKELFRYGKIFKLPACFNEVIYYGRGKGENYPDMKKHAPIGLYTLSVDDFTGDEIKPQECGNRCETRYAIVKNQAGRGLMFLGIKEAFNFNIDKYSRSVIEKAKHIEDLPQADSLYVHIDSEVRGCGSAACGPDTLPEYRIGKKDIYTLAFSVIPFSKVDGAALRNGHTVK